MHPYTGAVDPTLCWNQAGTARKAKDAFCGIEEVHASMVAAGDGAKGIWVTEFGWATNTTEYGVSEAVQADYLTKGFERLERYPYVEGRLLVHVPQRLLARRRRGELGGEHGSRADRLLAQAGAACAA